MGKNELGKVFNMAGRSCLFFLSFGQSHFKHTKTILITEKILLKNTIRNETTAANIALPQFGRTITFSTLSRYQSSVIGLTDYKSLAHFATLLVCKLSSRSISNFNFLTYNSNGRTQHQIPKLRQCLELTAIFDRHEQKISNIFKV